MKPQVVCCLNPCSNGIDLIALKEEWGSAHISMS